MVCERLDDFRNTHFKDDVHTALKVKTKTNTSLTTVLECVVAKVELCCIQRIQIKFSLFLFHLACLIIYHPSSYREAKVEAANESQCYSQKLDKSFVLHFD